LRRFRTEPKVDAALLESWKGYSVLKRVDEIGGEQLEYKNSKGKDEEIYVGVIPNVVEIHPDILPIPTIFKKMWIKKRWRIRFHHKLFNEPFTRDLYTGEILNQEKKRAVLEEKGFIDSDGFLLNQNGDRVSLQEGDEKVYVKVDVSDIDYIKAEYKAKYDSKMVEKAAEAMSKTGQKLDDKFYMIIACSIFAIVLVVFIMSGGLSSLGI